jgi:bis(5'-nucleosidyl)-tetraphosphatase
MKRERSAGVVVYSQRDGARHYLLLDYGRYWDFPKGHLEEGEDDRTAALRELAEETGLTDIHLHPDFFHEIAYKFKNRSGKLVDKTVAFFLAETKSEDITISDEHVGYAFVPFEEALAKVTYANARNVLKRAEARLTGGTTPDRLS